MLKCPERHVSSGLSGLENHVVYQWKCLVVKYCCPVLEYVVGNNDLTPPKQCSVVILLTLVENILKMRNRH